MRKLRTDFERRNAPSTPYVHYVVKKVQEIGILIDKSKCEKPKKKRIPENIAAVGESVCEAPSTSIHRPSQQLNILETSLRRILHKGLGITPYDVPLSGIVLQKMPILAKKIIFSDEAHFDLGWYVNK